MRYLPHTDEDIAAMLDAVGARTLEDLFGPVPLDCRRTRDLELPGPLTEWEVTEHTAALARNTSGPPDHKVYLGAGSYEHVRPASVSYLLNRSEFSTAYTPYQPEMSQGTLQALYEYQTLTARLLGMEAANASLYDGASALAEAVLMANRVTKRTSVAVSGLVHPFYRQVVRTYVQSAGFTLTELPYMEDGRTDLSPLDNMDEPAAVVVQSPNFFGCIEDLALVERKAHELGALFVTVFTEALAYGLLKSPGSLGADIVCGEGQSLGIPRSFGGPGLGIFTTLTKYVRRMPGRIVGRARDADGKRGFVLTLATREQHIRREKATSNICTNNSLCALTAAMFLASLGGTGIRDLARLNYDKSEYLKSGLREAGCTISFSGPTFNEFVVRFPKDDASMYDKLSDRGIVPGLPLGRWFPELHGRYLFCVTETKSKADLDALVREIAS
ncbi:MAG: aminomethyl-transferring glycine dehydrogenase subunit GcvPA [Pseudomonadota bacterium]